MIKPWSHAWKVNAHKSREFINKPFILLRFNTCMYLLNNFLNLNLQHLLKAYHMNKPPWYWSFLENWRISELMHCCIFYFYNRNLAEVEFIKIIYTLISIRFEYSKRSARSNYLCLNILVLRNCICCINNCYVCWICSPKSHTPHMLKSKTQTWLKS